MTALYAKPCYSAAPSSEGPLYFFTSVTTCDFWWFSLNAIFPPRTEHNISECGLTGAIWRDCWFPVLWYDSSAYRSNYVHGILLSYHIGNSISCATTTCGLFQGYCLPDFFPSQWICILDYSSPNVLANTFPSWILFYFLPFLNRLLLFLCSQCTHNLS